ncbi:MAG TPA: sugar ABC transporter substrate-binding protein [Solirubrobacterales bacterium]
MKKIEARRAKAVLVLVGLCALMALAAGCGSSSSSSSTDPGPEAGGGGGSTGAASAAVAAAEKPIASWNGFGPAIKPPSGKHIVAIECSSVGVGCVQDSNAVKAAGEKLGWSTSVVNGKGDPTVWNSAVQSAVASKADGIVLAAISPAIVKGAVAEAEKAGIPVIATLSGPPADALVLPDGQTGGTMMANFLTADSGGSADVLILNAPEFQDPAERNEILEQQLEEACGGCSQEVATFSFGTMAEKLSSQVSSALQADPNINYVVAPFDAAEPFVLQGIAAAGRTEVKLGTFEGDPKAMEGIGQGSHAADVATPNEWVGWAAVDDLARLMGSEKVAPITTVPVRLFTAKNAAEAAGWKGDLDFEGEYLKLWGKG